MFEQMLPYRARLYSNRPAVWTEAGEVGYAKFNSDVDRVALALRSAEVSKGAKVLIDVSRPSLHWLFILALERLGCVTVSAALTGGGDAVIRVVRPDLIVSTKPASTFAADQRLVSVTNEWLAACMAVSRPEFKRELGLPDDVVRITLSSGTTGKPKQIPLTRKLVDARLALTAVPMDVALRSITTMPPSAIGGFIQPLATWWAGGLIALPADFSQEALAASKANNLVMSTQQLATYVANYPEAFVGVTNTTVWVGGSVVPSSLLGELARRGDAQVFVGYGSTEAGLVSLAQGDLALRHPGSVGYLSPGARVEIVDSDNQPLPTGEAGEVRIRTSGLIDRYLDEDGDADSCFRDGWFHPGDVGRLLPSEELIIQGRVDDLINIGGVKMFPETIEEFVGQWPGITDSAAIALPASSGRWVLTAIICTDTDVDLDALEIVLKDRFKVPAKVFQAGSIPRNEMGKINRHALPDVVRQAIS